MTEKTSTRFPGRNRRQQRLEVRNQLGLKTRATLWGALFVVNGRYAAEVAFRLVRLGQRRTRALPAQMLQICSSSAGWA
jgi:hypothetical protein